MMKRLFSRWRGRALGQTAAQADFAIDLALFTDVGPVREHNEDCIAALNAPRRGERSDRTALVALADGMGGHQAGELASRLAVETALRVYGEAPRSSPADRLLLALVAANTAVYLRSLSAPELQGMGTTLLLFAPGDDGAYCAWVGDSRLYRWRAGAMAQITRDDTVVRELVERGLVDARTAADHPDHSVLTQALGTQATLSDLHVFGPIDIAVGDRFLLCSDGIHDVVSSEQLAQALASTCARSAVDGIHHLALENHANDNLSIGVARVEAPRPMPSAARRTAVDVEVLT